MNDSELEDALPCDGKLAFDFKKQAQATATTVEYQHGSSVKPYLCNYCKLWHLATSYKD